jgi:hypothetical protein
MKRCLAITSLALALGPWTAPSFAQKFRPDDPVLVDDDSVASAKQVQRSKPSDYFDFLLNTFGHPGDRRPIRAVNINTLGEVPDSSWFQNRHGQHRMFTEDLVRGPNQTGGPSTDGKWIVIGAKTEGVTPGFRIRDSRGDVYVMKFDPKDHAEMATAAEVISTKFFYAMGFNVPENYIATFRRERLIVAATATIRDALGKERRMTEKDLDDILKRMNQREDKTYRAMASRFLSGKPVGPFRYYGTRSDDPNDIFPHEHRRELRGLWVMAAWLDHDDSRAINTLDMLVSEQNRQFVRHYLIDFGSTLGSGSTTGQKPRAGWEYLWDPSAAMLRIATLGLVDKPWVRAKYNDSPSLGRLEFDTFQPYRWKPEYPNPAFENAQPEDSYWAAKIVMAFTDDDIRAIVKAGQLSDPNAEALLVKWLILRRDRIGKLLLTALPSIDRFELANDLSLNFEYLASEYGFVPSPSSYAVRWFRFDNNTGQMVPISPETSYKTAHVPLPAAVLSEPNGYFVARIFESGSADGVAVTIRRNEDNQFRIVGIERDVTRGR